MQPNILWIKNHFIQYFLSWLYYNLWRNPTLSPRFSVSTPFPSALLTPHQIKPNWVQPRHFMWQYLLKFVSYVWDYWSLKTYFILRFKDSLIRMNSYKLLWNQTENIGGICLPNLDIWVRQVAHNINKGSLILLANRE